MVYSQRGLWEGSSLLLVSLVPSQMFESGSQPQILSCRLQFFKGAVMRREGTVVAQAQAGVLIRWLNNQLKKGKNPQVNTRENMAISNF